MRDYKILLQLFALLIPNANNFQKLIPVPCNLFPVTSSALLTLFLSPRPIAEANHP